jgi:hypothetical protein
MGNTGHKVIDNSPFQHKVKYNLSCALLSGDQVTLTRIYFRRTEPRQKNQSPHTICLQIKTGFDGKTE